MSSSARCSPTPTASRSASETTSRPRSPPTRPTKMRRRTRRTPRAWPTIRRLGKVMQHLLKDDTQVYKQFVENESFRRFVGDMVFAITSRDEGGATNEPRV